MAQATTNAAIEAGLHAAITKEAKKNNISFSEQVSRYRKAWIEEQEFIRTTSKKETKK